MDIDNEVKDTESEAKIIDCCTEAPKAPQKIKYVRQQNTGEVWIAG